MTRAEEIAEKLRTRIATGALRPGDAVPSTRAIMRDHGVAMATASRVLAQLQSDGLIESIPGRGSRVLAPAGVDPAMCTRDGIVRIAVEIADAESMPAVSMRRLAAAVGIPTMGVYRFVSSRDELELGMLDEVMGEVDPGEPSGDWRADVEACMSALWATMVRHPWFAGALSLTRPVVIPNAMALTERVLGGLYAAGLEPVQAFTDYLCLMNLMRSLGMTLEAEQADRSETGVDNDQWMDSRIGDLRRVAPAGEFPNLGRIVAAGYPYDSDVLCESGVRRFLDGVESGLSSRER